MKALVGSDNSIGVSPDKPAQFSNRFLAKRLVGHRSFLVRTC
jgi:hypothetical protein